MPGPYDLILALYLSMARRHRIDPIEATHSGDAARLTSRDFRSIRCYYLIQQGVRLSAVHAVQAGLQDVPYAMPRARRANPNPEK